MYFIRRNAFILASAFALVGASIFHAAEAPRPPAQPQIIALIGGLIRTQTDAGDFIGTIIIRDGKIVAVGPNVEVPAEAKQIDVAGHVITPGLIDAHGTMGLQAASVRDQGRDGTFDILDGVNPYDSDWRDTAQQGITAVYVQPSGSLSGSGAVLMARGSITAPEKALKAHASVQASLGVSTEAAAASGPNPLAAIFAQLGLPAPPAQTSTPTTSNTLTRYAAYESLRSQFDAAKRYSESKPTRIDIAKDLLARAIRREIPVRIEVGHEDDLKNALQLAQDFKLRLCLERLDRVKPIPEELSGRKLDLIVGPLWPAKNSAEVRKLALDGRRFALGTFGEETKAPAWLRGHAAMAIADGYPRERMLRAMTKDAADILGVGDKAGSITVGRMADLAVFAGDPLDPAVPVRLTMCQGVITYDRAGAEASPTIVAAKPTLPTQMPPRFSIKTTRMMTQNGEFVPGELFVEDGRITTRSPGSGGTPEFDLGDAPVTPGLASAQVVTFNEQTPDADAGHLRGADGLSPHDARLKALRSAGILSAVVVPGSNNVIAGMASSVNGTEASGANDSGIKLVFSATPRDANRFPQSLFGQVDMIHARLRGEPSQSDLLLPLPVRKALLANRDASLLPVRDGKSVAWCEANTAAEVRAALKVVAEHKLRGVLVAPKDIDELAEEIRAADVPVVITGLTLNDTEKSLVGLVNLAKLHVPLAFAGDSNEVRTSTAWLVNAGLPRSIARRALIAQPADRFGLPPSAGRLAAGDPADFVVWTGDPVDLGQRPAAVIAHGQRLGGS